MREKKYANILDEEEKEERLSMTRELKFKNLQEELDQSKELETSTKRKNKKEENLTFDPLDNEETAPVSIEEFEKTVASRKLKEDIDKELQKASKEEIKEEVKEDKKESKDNQPKDEDDIYLTSSFKPFKKRFRLKKVFKILLILIILGGLGVALYFFVAKPIYNKIVQTMPEEIFHNSINNIRDYAITFLEDDLSGDKEYLDIKIGIESNDEDISVFNNQKFGLTIGVDSINKRMEYGTYVLKDETKYGYSIMYDEKYAYINLITTDNIIKLDTDEFDIEEDLNGIYKELEESFKNIEYTSKEEKEYLINKVALELNNLITKDNVTSEKDEITILGNTKSVTRNTLSFDKESMEQFEKDFYDSLKNDSKFVEILKKCLDIETDEELESYFETSEYEDDLKIEFNIYTINGTEFVGFDIVENGFRSIYYYVDGDNFNLHINLTDDEELCEEGQDCTLDTQEVYDFTGSKEDDHQKIIVTKNSQEIMTIILREFSKDKIDFDIEYKYTSEDEESKDSSDEDSTINKTENEENKTETKTETCTISVYIEMINEQFKGEINFQDSDDEYIKLSLDMEISTTKEIAIIDENKVISYKDNEKKANEALDEFDEELSSKEMDDIFYTWDGYIDLLIELINSYDEYLPSNDEVTTV